MDSPNASRGGGCTSRGGRGGGRGSFSRGGRGGNNMVIRSSNSINGDDAVNYTSPDASPLVGLDNIRNSENRDEESSHIQPPLGGSNEPPLGGLNAAEQIPPNSSYRENIWLVGKVFNKPEIGTKIVKIFKSMYHGPWATWADVDNDSRKRIFERFLNLYTWHPEIHEQIYEAWENHLQNRMYDIMSECRKLAQNDARRAGLVFDDDDLSVLIPYNRPWMKHEYWVTLINQKWNNERWKQSSKGNKKNRNSKVDGQVAKHTGGSRSLTHTRLYLEKKKGCKISGCELIAHYYTKKRSTSEESETSLSAIQEFVDPRAKDFMEKYSSAFFAKYGEDADINEITDMELWEQCGASKRGRLIGSGRQQDPYFLLTGTHQSQSSASSSCSAADVEEMQRLKEKVETLQENEHTLRQEMEAQKLSMEQQTKELQEDMRALSRMIFQQIPPRDPPSST